MFKAQAVENFICKQLPGFPETSSPNFWQYDLTPDLFKVYIKGFLYITSSQKSPQLAFQLSSNFRSMCNSSKVFFTVLPHFQKLLANASC